jgi:hypothetical protein
MNVAYDMATSGVSDAYVVVLFVPEALATAASTVVLHSRASTYVCGRPCYDDVTCTSEATVMARTTRRTQGLPDSARIAPPRQPTLRGSVPRTAPPTRVHRVQHRAA